MTSYGHTTMGSQLHLWASQGGHTFLPWLRGQLGSLQPRAKDEDLDLLCTDMRGIHGLPKLSNQLGISCPDQWFVAEH